MMWEIFVLKIINSLYLSEYIKKEKISDVEFTQIINEVLAQLFDDIDMLKNCPEANFSEFGTRRSMSTNFQRLVNEILTESLP
jgi:nicotinic acid phosphoribosyltransferase